MTSRLIGAGILSALAFLLWAATSQTHSAPNLFEETRSENTLHIVARVLDGDTIVLDSGAKVRYIGIDTPEIYGGRTDSECFAHEARERNEQLILNKRVRLETDVSETDSYGRLLRYVYIAEPTSSIHPDTSVNEILVAEGYAVARSYPPDVTRQDDLRTAERDARTNERGLWGPACN